MKTILSVLEDFFQNDDWNYVRLEDTTILNMAFQGQNGRYECFAQAREQQHQCVFYSVSPLKVPPEKRHVVMEFITRANYGMVLGNFELDLSDGEVRYRTSLDVEDVDFTPTMVRNLVYPNLLIMDRYFPGVMRVVYGGLTAEEAIQEIER